MIAFKSVCAVIAFGLVACVVAMPIRDYELEDERQWLSDYVESKKVHGADSTKHLLEHLSSELSADQSAESQSRLSLVNAYLDASHDAGCALHRIRELDDLIQPYYEEIKRFDPKRSRSLIAYLRQTINEQFAACSKFWESRLVDAMQTLSPQVREDIKLLLNIMGNHIRARQGNYKDERMQKITYSDADMQLFADENEFAGALAAVLEGQGAKPLLINYAKNDELKDAQNFDKVRVGVCAPVNEAFGEIPDAFDAMLDKLLTGTVSNELDAVARQYYLAAKVCRWIASPEAKRLTTHWS